MKKNTINHLEEIIIENGGIAEALHISGQCSVLDHI